MTVAKTRRLIVRLSEGEYRALKRAARVQGRTMSDLVREAAAAAADEGVGAEADGTLDEVWRSLFEEEIPPGEVLLPPFDLGLKEFHRADLYEDLEEDVED